MGPETPFDPLERFAEIERLAAKVYFQLSHLFPHHAELREFWWQMAMDEEQHASVLLACKTIVDKVPRETMNPSVNQQTAGRLEAQLQSYLDEGSRSISVDRAFNIALEMETSELDIIYTQLLESCGPQVAKTMAKFGVAASEQRKKLKTAIFRFSMEPKLRAAAGVL